MAAETERFLTSAFFFVLLVLAFWFRISGADRYHFWSVIILMLGVLLFGVLRSNAHRKSHVKL